MINLNNFILERLKLNSDTKIEKEYQLIVYSRTYSEQKALEEFEDEKECIGILSGYDWKLFIVSSRIINDVKKRIRHRNSYVDFYKLPDNMSIKDIRDTWKNVRSLSDIIHFFEKFTEIEI